jgi:hypothetical protein
MAAPAPTILPIFATPFAIVPIEGAAELNAALRPLLLSRATDTCRDPDLPRDPLCFRSREDLLEWQIEPIEQLRRQLLGALCAAVMGATGLSETEFDALRMQARARFTIVHPDGAVPVSSATMASWYALYCVAAPASPGRADGGALRLYAVRDGTMFIDAANWRLPGPFSRSHYHWPPVPGRMAVFPASITHEIALNRGTEDLVLVMLRARFAHAGQTVVPPW